MSCYLSNAIELGCSDGLGGLSEIWILGGSSGATVTGYTYDANDQITGATGSGTWYKFALKRNTSSLTQTLAKSFENNSTYFDISVVGVFYKYDYQNRDFAKVLSQNDNVLIIAVDFNGVQYLVGQENGAYMSAAEIGTGTALGDRNGGSITWLAQEQSPAPIISGALATVFSGFTFTS